MNPNPKLARLQVIERLHAECVQQLRAVSDIAVAGAFGSKLSGKLCDTVDRLERAFRELSDPRTYAEPTAEASDQPARNQEGSIRSELSWLTDSVHDLATLTFTHSLAEADCDAILTTIAMHNQSTTVLA